MFKDKELEWMFKHSYYPTRHTKEGYWIGGVGPFKTIRKVIQAAMKLENVYYKAKGF